MQQTKLRLLVLLSVLSLVLLGIGHSADAQERCGTPQPQGAKAAGHPSALTATLVNPEHHAKEHAATVQVSVAGVVMVDPATVKEEPKDGQGHLHYQVDNGPVVATTATRAAHHCGHAGGE
jgi:hypothetical protein